VNQEFDCTVLRCPNFLHAPNVTAGLVFESLNKLIPQLSYPLYSQLGETLTSFVFHLPDSNAAENGSAILLYSGTNLHFQDNQSELAKFRVYGTTPVTHFANPTTLLDLSLVLINMPCQGGITRDIGGPPRYLG
jgi:hypothetical protein